MEAEDLNELAKKIINNEVEGVHLQGLFPFLKKSDFEEIIGILIQKKDGKNLKYAIPFMSEETVNQLLVAIRNNEIDHISEEDLYPFLSKETIKELFETYLKEASKTS